MTSLSLNFVKVHTSIALFHLTECQSKPCVIYYRSYFLLKRLKMAAASLMCMAPTRLVS